MFWLYILQDEAWGLEHIDNIFKLTRLGIHIHTCLWASTHSHHRLDDDRGMAFVTLWISISFRNDRGISNIP